MAPEEVRRLRDLGQAARATDDDKAFIGSTATVADDDLAEELAEAAVTKMTSGQDDLVEQLEANVAEDNGGPFIETSDNVEFASGTDESNIPEATREPFPTANGTGKK